MREWASEMTSFAEKTHTALASQLGNIDSLFAALRDTQKRVEGLEDKVVELTRRVRHSEGKAHAD